MAYIIDFDDRCAFFISAKESSGVFKRMPDLNQAIISKGNKIEGMGIE